MPGAGPRIRTDLVEVYVFRRRSSGAEFLLLRRMRPPQQGAWHPVLGHVMEGERAVVAALRELREETGLDAAGDSWRAIWQLEQVHPFFLADEDAIVMCPRFVVEAAGSWSPALNEEHDSFTWVAEHDIEQRVVWPGQRASCAEALSSIVRDERRTPLVL